MRDQIASAADQETPIDRILGSRITLDTPAARFARAYEALRSDAAAIPAPSERFRSLAPLSAPAPGEQYAFEVDLDQCTGCKACVTACHSMNGLEPGETWREVGLLAGGTESGPYLQTVTTACHHCGEPACLEGCPVNAYEKDPATGIVLHLDDQCIGCQYCVLKCPYDVPKYSEDLGIVRKCDLCHGRLAEGEAPACAQACPNEAIRIVTTPAPRADALEADATLTPGAVDSGYTLPTTRYRTARPEAFARSRPADAHAVRPPPAHWPLILMLVGTQSSLGLLAAAVATEGVVRASLLVGALAACLGGLGASVFHLGRPLKAWRAFLGLAHSWLSREICLFGVYAPLLGMIALEPLFAGRIGAEGRLGPWVSWAALGVGTAGVFASAMLYHDTRRPFWKLPRAGGKFFGTAAILGAAGAWLAASATGGSGVASALALTGAGAAKLLAEAGALVADAGRPASPLAGSRRLLLGPLRGVLAARLALGALGAVVLPLAGLAAGGAGPEPAALAGASLLLCAAGEVAERYAFFRAVVPYKMPGGVSA